MIFFRIFVAAIIFVPNSIFAQSPKIYEEAPPNETIPMCVTHKCVEAGSASGSIGNAQTAHGRETSNSSQPSSEESRANEFGSTYVPSIGILGASTDLEAEFRDFVAANRTFASSFSRARLSSGSSSAPTFDPGDFSSSSIYERGNLYATEAWSTVINSQNAYFESIAGLADAATDSEAQNAIAHATISAHLTMELGEEIAEAIGDTKEVVLQGGDLDTAKDLLNNAAGREIAKDILTNGGAVEDIPAAISSAYRDGDLWIIRNDEVVPSNNVDCEGCVQVEP